VEPACGRSGAAEHVEAFAQHDRRIEFVERQHRPQAIDELERARAVDVRPAAIGDGLVVAALELDAELERLARPHIAQESRLEGKRRHRPSAKIDVVHRDPRGKLAHGLGNEARRKSVESFGDREKPARVGTPSRVFANPVDEREGREMIAHARGIQEPFRQASAPCFCAAITSLQNVSGVKSRGISLTFIGVRKRSAGTSDK